mmetsp:Transcript_6088/g.5236  ORF Transcript_6088/g.5236 Transcript_6088/m.5236 type:complete len:219 (-) Transcript_6088:63-719(-)
MNKEGFSEVFEQIKELYISKTFEKVYSFQKIKEEPLLVADLLSMLKKYLKECPEKVFCSSSFKSLMELTNLCCEIEHQDLSTVLISFQTKLFMVLQDISTGYLVLPVPEEQSIEIAEEAFQNGAIIVQKYMKVILDVPLQDILENIIDFLVDLVIQFPKQAIGWLRAILIDIPSNILSDAEKEDFCLDFDYGNDSAHTIQKSFRMLSKRAEQVKLQSI